MGSWIAFFACLAVLALCFACYVFARRSAAFSADRAGEGKGYRDSAWRASQSLSQRLDDGR